MNWTNARVQELEDALPDWYVAIWERCSLGHPQIILTGFVPGHPFVTNDGRCARCDRIREAKRQARRRANGKA